MDLSFENTSTLRCSVGSAAKPSIMQKYLQHLPRLIYGGKDNSKRKGSLCKALQKGEIKTCEYSMISEKLPSTNSLSPQGRTTTTRTTTLYCCGCHSRTSTIIVNAILLVVGCLYVVVCVAGLTDTSSSSAPTESEQTYIESVLIALLIQIVVASVALWGACTYRGWPVMIILAWVSISIVINFANMILAMNPLLIVGIFLQAYLFWMPMFGYLSDFENL